MDIAIWSDDYATGDAAVDGQHQELFRMVNELHEAIMSGKGKAAQGPMLKALADYAARHFAIEEHLMSRTGYPDLHHHKLIHDGLKQQVSEMIATYESGSLLLPSTLSSFLTQWLTEHIKREDMRMIQWVQGHS